MATRSWDVGILGATGMVGQQLVRRLEGHPWFRLAWVAASERSEGKRYGDTPWLLGGSVPAYARDLVLDKAEPGRAPRLVFSALDAGAAGPLERAFAEAGRLVVSNARTHRLADDVPLLIPEVNAGHLDLLPTQRAARGWSGAIVTNPNCSTTFLAIVLAACRPFSPRRVIVTTFQAASGAGHPGVASWDLLGNVVPFIDGEEEKIERETRKILGTCTGRSVMPAPVAVSAQAARVPVLDGHTEAISVEFDRVPEEAELAAALGGFTGLPPEAGLPSAPARPIVHLREPDRPQPRLDALREDGMAVCVGRVRRCPVLHYKLVALGHNTIRGAAGAAILNAELLVARGWAGGGGRSWS
ncbi:MAG TPA: aspartate-semialdehyde dehydrogenase [Vicinamibacterales bacterium]|nr:aspartate-semialdehyde dehydrogenase [Vicinamibacterales bacterium]HOG30040.1 aspartate-semialdehyde dehydrogenase [Vicinamibacterales bacterium]HOQ60103.1 aspartate-semialdehyde dehydrogenase [Vicinamibacterales bacterium]HPW19878.1 aspartate-semialdehyde dehydrogenase [Vicinamibacterales bacterium]